ncbi:MAG TPA: hypothetical protein PKU96_01185 [bacterium]|nr:hypothetical protein [Myxococcales bacterium]OQA61079.1 MAG: hypothetical protein BWY40_00750 [bacterium ADurb.Bin270]HPW44967.1 hypothetical protein [bacterium]HQC50695.1 hypothetical protein [bacterium]HQG14205.1 hypothetical protein [bacterium]
MSRKKRPTAPFFKQLAEVVKDLKDMKPGEVHVISVNANYGHYEIVIGPENSEDRQRPIEINGEIHHLFVSPEDVRPLPTKRQITSNLKNTVIVKHLTIHLKDPKGDGKNLTIVNHDESGLRAREFINLAGKDGEQLASDIERDSKYSLAAYQIVQKDILSSFSSGDLEEESSG